ncbi:MAG: IclR family transcriptional regulator [Aquamicrobium sp.]|uniref:IclR family transcriptional regulator n=1 Tax=Aquamicrobium sp. TaxID=1872579 RepID=UPI00349EDA45|nr:IclR family transcriptional regulator [Aquamicrobium sp.]
MKTTVGRTLAILECVSRSDGITPAEMAKAVGLPASTIYRYLAILVEQGFARKDGNRFMPGHRLHSMQNGEPGYQEFVSLIHDDLEALTFEGGATVFLCVREGAYSHAIKVIEPAQRLKLTMQAGERLPLYASASSKILLAFADENFQRAYLKTTELKPLASGTIRDPEELRKGLQEIRSRGYAISMSEVDEMAAAVAFPIVDRNGSTVMSLAVSGIEQRFVGQSGEELVALVGKYASIISEKLAHYQNLGAGTLGEGGRDADD